MASMDFQVKVGCLADTVPAACMTAMMTSPQTTTIITGSQSRALAGLLPAATVTPALRPQRNAYRREDVEME